MFLNGLGIYIGRFLRLHTVYLLNAPLKIVKEVLIIDVKSVTICRFNGAHTSNSHIVY